MKYPFLAVAAWALVSLAFAPPIRSQTEPVSFAFTLPADRVAEPFAAEAWGEVELPSGDILRIPAFYDGEGRFVVRANAAATGTYHLRRILLSVGGSPVPAPGTPLTPATVTRRVAQGRSFVRLNPENPRRFADTGAQPYFPVGANVAWTTGASVTGFYRDVFADFATTRLNWTRIWMCHWGRLNLDWLPGKVADSPQPGAIDSDVAARWDEIVHLAEASAIYIQMVLQHHGQYSTEVDSNWSDNPWNAAHPNGFLETPAEFFTSPRARELTKRKYRYIVARWGYSPAILAWELFNEVHWVDALRLENDTAAVAAWHAEMAAYLRSIDAHHHLVTTSCDPVTSPLFAGMDFLQPHLYPNDLLLSIARYDLDPASLERPVFYGEFGPNNTPLPDEVIRAGTALVPPIWASLMGTGHFVAQPWEGERIRTLGRLPELGAVARFATAHQLSDRGDLQPFTPLVRSDTRVPLRITPGRNWHRGPNPTVTVPTDGRVNVALGELPGTLVSSARGAADGFPDRMTFQIDAPHDTNARITLGDAGSRGAALRVRLNERTVTTHRWAPEPRNAETKSIAVPLTTGLHTLAIENTGNADWFAFTSLELDLDVPIIAATGKRSDDFLMLWLWHRRGVFAVDAPPAVTGTIVIDHVPAGHWKVTWWNSVDGTAAPPQTIAHPGGELALPTPSLRRHAALALEKESSVSP